MRQLLQHLDSGQTRLAEVPAPAPTAASLLVETRASVVSPGTERMLVEFGRASLLEKARRQPDRVREVLDKLRADGVTRTVEAVRSRLSEPIQLGYCAAGVVRQVGEGVPDFSPGDRVVTNGPHAEVVRVPRTLAARIPERVSFQHAAFAPLGAIALQGIRNASPELGEEVVVYGLGVVGLLTVQLLRANGCRVLGIDLLEDRLDQAERFGATPVNGNEGVVDRVLSETAGRGADAVLLTLDSESSRPVHLAAGMTRKRGRLVLVGVAGLDLQRSDYYAKELSLTVSCSYGPGRYDPEYESGRDYPLPFVRWTAQRNFQAFLHLVADGSVDVEPLISHRFPFSSATEAYDLLTEGRQQLGIVLTYRDSEPDAAEQASRPVRSVEIRAPGTVATGVPRVGVVGAGGFAQRVILPLLGSLSIDLRVVASSAGTSAARAARKFGAARATTDLEDVFGDPEIDTVFVLTPHDSHAELALRALDTGKHVFVEKPLALTGGELERIERSLADARTLLTVGFNRRFAPSTARLMGLLEGRSGTLTVLLTVNAGSVPEDHWIHDPRIGGGRIVGEGCHFVDLARALVGGPIVDVEVDAARDSARRPVGDVAVITLRFEDGSVAAIHYLSTGARSFPKERVECFWDRKTAVIDNWRRVRTYGTGRRLPELMGRQDKGHRAELTAWLRSVRDGGPPPIPYAELFEVSRATLEAAERLRSR